MSEYKNNFRIGSLWERNHEAVHFAGSLDGALRAMFPDHDILVVQNEEWAPDSRLPRYHVKLVERTEQPAKPSRQARHKDVDYGR